MPKLSEARIKARIEVLEQAGSWILDQCGESCSDIFEDSTNDTDLLIEEAEKLYKRLYSTAKKLRDSIGEN